MKSRNVICSISKDAENRQLEDLYSLDRLLEQVELARELNTAKEIELPPLPSYISTQYISSVYKSNIKKSQYRECLDQLLTSLSIATH